MMAILVAHPYPVVRDGIATAVRTRLGQPDVAVAANSAACLDLAKTLRPSVAVVDLQLVPGGELGLCEALQRYEVPVVALTRRGCVDALALLEAGAQGIVFASEGLDELLIAVRAVLKGHAHVPTHLLGQVLHGLVIQRRAQVAATTKVSRLSPREREVLALLSDGADQRVIAARLVISPHTAKTHIQRVLAKLEVRSRAEAVALAAAHGVTAPEREVLHG